MTLPPRVEILRYLSRPLDPPDFLKTPEKDPHRRLPRDGEVPCSACKTYWAQPDELTRIGLDFYCHHCGLIAEVAVRRVRPAWEVVLAAFFWGLFAGIAFLLLMYRYFGDCR